MTASKARRLRREQALSPKGQRLALVRPDALKNAVASRVEPEPPQTALRHDAVGKMSQRSGGKRQETAPEKVPTVMRRGSSDKKFTPFLSSDNAAFPPADEAKAQPADLAPLFMGLLGTILSAHPAALVIGTLPTVIGTDE